MGRIPPKLVEELVRVAGGFPSVFGISATYQPSMNDKQLVTFLSVVALTVLSAIEDGTLPLSKEEEK